MHHNVLMSVQAHLKGRHKEHCLCYQGCLNFHPGEPGHCQIAQKLFALDQVYGLVTPVWECGTFRREEHIISEVKSTLIPELIRPGRRMGNTIRQAEVAVDWLLEGYSVLVRDHYKDGEDRNANWTLLAEIRNRLRERNPTIVWNLNPDELIIRLVK